MLPCGAKLVPLRRRRWKRTQLPYVEDTSGVWPEPHHLERQCLLERQCSIHHPARSADNPPSL